MIRPLRRRHAWIIPVLAVVLATAAALAITHPSPSARVPMMPRAIAETGAEALPR